MDDDGLPAVHRMNLISACRTTVGDELRSITYFTDDTVTQVYRRDDLSQTADLVGFAENERLGFRSQVAYRNSQLGKYEATIRMFEKGFLTRIINEPHGVWVTTDPMPIDRFEELASVLESLLETEFPRTACTA